MDRDPRLSRSPGPRRCAPVIGALLALAACGGGSPSGPGQSPPGTAVRLQILAPDTLIVGLRSTVTMSAQGRTSAGGIVDPGTITWSSKSPEIATVSPAGIVTGQRTGTARVEVSNGQLSTARSVVVVAVTGQGSDRPDRRIATFLTKWGVPGASLAVVQSGRLVHAKGYGTEDVATGASVDPTALFRVASLSKAITSLATMKLVEEGRLDLDDRVFPDILTGFWSAAQNSGADPRLADIRVRDLLLHSGGWQRPPRDPMFMEREIATAAGIASPAPLDETVRYMISEGTDFLPGTAAYYSNFGYALLGLALEKAGGASYETVVNSRVFGPAGASRAVLGATLEADRLTGEVRYHGLGSEGAPAPSAFDSGPSTVPWPYGGFYVEAMAAHGGWVASAVDFARFLTVIDGEPTVPDLISDASRQEMGTIGGLPGNIFNYAMGWFSNGAGDWWHFGRLPGTGAYASISPSRGLAYVILLNASSPNESIFLTELADLVDAAVLGVSSWPAEDLFGQFP